MDPNCHRMIYIPQQNMELVQFEFLCKQNNQRGIRAILCSMDDHNYGYNDNNPKVIYEFSSISSRFSVGGQSECIQTHQMVPTSNRFVFNANQTSDTQHNVVRPIISAIPSPISSIQSPISVRSISVRYAHNTHSPPILNQQSQVENERKRLRDSNINDEPSKRRRSQFIESNKDEQQLSLSPNCNDNNPEVIHEFNPASSRFSVGGQSEYIQTHQMFFPASNRPVFDFNQTSDTQYNVLRPITPAIPSPMPSTQSPISVHSVSPISHYAHDAHYPAILNQQSQVGNERKRLRDDNINNKPSKRRRSQFIESDEQEFSSNFPEWTAFNEATANNNNHNPFSGNASMECCLFELESRY